MKIAHLRVYHKTHPIKFFLLNMEIFSWEYTLICLFKINIRLLESDQKWLRHGSSTKPLLSRCKGDNTSKKLIL